MSIRSNSPSIHDNHQRNSTTGQNSLATSMSGTGGGFGNASTSMGGFASWGGGGALFAGLGTGGDSDSSAAGNRTVTFAQAPRTAADSMARAAEAVSGDDAVAVAGVYKGMPLAGKSQQKIVNRDGSVLTNDQVMNFLWSLPDGTPIEAEYRDGTGSAVWRGFSSVALMTQNMRNPIVGFDQIENFRGLLVIWSVRHSDEKAGAHLKGEINANSRVTDSDKKELCDAVTAVRTDPTNADISFQSLLPHADVHYVRIEVPPTINLEVMSGKFDEKRVSGAGLTQEVAQSLRKEVQALHEPGVNRRMEDLRVVDYGGGIAAGPNDDARARSIAQQRQDPASLKTQDVLQGMMKLQLQQQQQQQQQQSNDGDSDFDDSHEYRGENQLEPFDSYKASTWHHITRAKNVPALFVKSTLLQHLALSGISMTMKLDSWSTAWTHLLSLCIDMLISNSNSRANVEVTQYALDFVRLQQASASTNVLACITKYGHAEQTDAMSALMAANVKPISKTSTSSGGGGGGGRKKKQRGGGSRPSSAYPPSGNEPSGQRRLPAPPAASSSSIKP